MAAKIYRFFAYYSAKERMDRSRELRFVLMDQVNDPNSVIDIDMEISGQNRSGSKITKPFSYRGPLSGLIKAANEFAIDISEFVNSDASGNIGLRYINQETGKKERYRIQLRETPLGVSAKFDSGFTQIRDTYTLVNDRRPTSETIFSFKFGDQAKRLDPFKPIQMYIAQSTETNNNNFHLTIYAEEGVKVFGIVLPDNFPAVFDITNNNRIQSSANGVEDYYNLSGVNLRFKPGKTFEDLYASEYRVEVSFLKRDGDNVELSPWTGSLLPKNKGFFQAGWHNLAFFNAGTPPEMATLKIVNAEEGKGRFLSNGVDITPTIGKYTTLYINLKNSLGGYIPSRDAIRYLRENPATPVMIVDPNTMRNPLERFVMFLSKIENVSDDKIRSIRKIDYIINAPNGLTPQGSLFDEVNQIYFMSPFTGNPMIVVNCNDGIVVDRIEVVRTNNASSKKFTINGNPVKNTNMKGYTQALTVKSHKWIELILDDQPTINVTISKSGRSESKQLQLVEGTRGRFAGQAMFFAFFDHGVIPSKITYGDFQHEHPYGRKPILFKAYENNGTTPLQETTAVSFYINSRGIVPFYPIRKPQGQDYWGMPVAAARDGLHSKIPNIAVIDANKVIRKLSDYSERASKSQNNWTTFLVFDKKQNRLEFKLHSTNQVVAKNIEYLLAKKEIRGNLAQPETRLTDMVIFFVDDDTGIASIIADFNDRNREVEFTQNGVEHASFTDELNESLRWVRDAGHASVYTNTLGMNISNNRLVEKLDKLISAGRKGKVVIAFIEDTENNQDSLYDYKYAYWCRLRDDIVQHNANSRFLVFTGVDDIYTVPKMVDFQISQDQSYKGGVKFTNRSTTGGYIYDADKKPYAYKIGHPIYERLDPSTNTTSLGQYPFLLHNNDDAQINTSSKPLTTHVIPYTNRFSYDNRTELLVVGINGLGNWEHSIESIGVIGAGALPSPEPELATDDVERVIWRAATGNIGAFSQTMAQIKFKSSIPAERRNGNTVYFRILDSKGNRLGQSSVTIGQYQQFNTSLGVLNDISSPYLTIESYTDASYTRKVSETRIPNALFGRQQTVASINNGQPFTAAQSNNLYMQYYLYPESLKITNVNPAITINDTSVINSKYVVVVDQNIPPQRDAYFFGHGSWRMTSKMSGNKLYMGAPIYDNFPAGTKQDYFLEWQEGGELKGISGPHDLPTNIKSVGDNANIPNGFLVLDNQARGQLTLTADNNFITNTTYRVESVEGNTRTTIVNKGYTGFRQNPQSTFDVNFPGKTPQTLAISQTKINVEMTVDNNLVTSKSLGFANNQLSSTAYGAILPLSNTGSTIPKYSTSVVKSQDDPVVTFNLNSQNRNNTIGKIAVLRPGNNGLSRAEINHDGSANGIHVPFDYFTKAGNNDSYEAMFLLYGKGADANKVIGHAVISLPRNQLKEESPDYDFGLGQIVMILNKAGNGAVIKAMVPHGLLSRADEFVLLNERQPNSTYNVTMETGGLYDIVSIDGALKDAPQPGSTVLQFGIRKDGELKRGKRITLTQLNTSVDVENHDNANKRVYSFGYGMADTSNRIDVKLVKIEDRVHVFFTNEAGINVSHEVDGFTLVHNSVEGNVIAAVGQIDKKLKRSSGSFALPISDYPQLGKMAEIVNSNDKHHGVVLVHRPVSGNTPAIYHNEGFIHTSSELPLMNLSSFGVRYIRVHAPDADHGLTVGVGKEWYHRYTSPSSKEYDNKGLRIPRIEYTNANGGTSVSDVSTESERGIVYAAVTSGKGILPKDIQEGSDKYAEFTVVNPATNQPERIKLYKDPYDPRLYARRYTPRTTDVKYIAYHSEVNNQHILPLPGVIKRSGNIGFDVDYTLRRNALVRDMDIVNRERFLPFDHIYRIAYIDRSRYNNFAEINTFFSILSRSRETLSASPYTSGISTSAYYSALLPDINQDFTENCGEVNKTRDLSDWQMETTLLDLTARLDMSEYPIMEITGTDMQPISTDILRIRGPRNGKPIILNKEYNQIFTTPPRILVIEEDIQFAAANGINVREMILFNSNLSIIPTVVFRGRLIVYGLSSGLIGITQSFTAINDTHWDFYQLLSGIPLSNHSTNTNASTNIGTTPPTAGEATIDIVSEYIHERTGSTSLSSNIVGARKFISISKKDNLYGAYDNMVNESGDSFDLAVVEIAVKLPGDSNKYPIAVDKKTRHYVGDTVRYYISGNLPEPLRRNPWDDPLQVEIVTTIYRGVGNGSRYEIIRSARGRLVSWQHPQ